jgi:cation:H+ antiporter
MGTLADTHSLDNAMIAFAGIVVGILLLICGGTALVHGASQAAARFGVPPLVVGLTIVAFGTSMPELVVNLVGAYQGYTGLVFGNIVGSNIANLALVLGVAAFVHPLVLHGDLVRREVPLLLLGTTVLTVLALDGYFEGQPARIGAADSIVMLLIFSVFIYVTIVDVLRVRKRDPIVQDIHSSPLVITRPVSRFPAFYILLGAALLYAGGEVTVRSSVDLAGLLGLSIAQVGLFVVAIGTSMPELVTSVIAAARKESDLAVGNVVGSNIVNAMLVLSATGLVADISIPDRGVLDLAFSWLLALALVPLFFIGKARIGRVAGGVLVLSYLTWAAVRLA